MGRLFGTDGIRGIANTELGCDKAMVIGRATATVLSKGLEKKPTVIIGSDTRASSEMLGAAVSAGICSAGANVIMLGVVPTPAVAHLVKLFEADAVRCPRLVWPGLRLTPRQMLASSFPPAITPLSITVSRFSTVTDLNSPTSLRKRLRT